MDYEYKCVGAPERPKRSRRAKTPSDRVARAMELIIREEAVNGWEYLRTDLVPVTEKTSFLGRAQEVHRAVMVFRRDLETRRNRPSEGSRRQQTSAELFTDSGVDRHPPRPRPAVAEEPPVPVQVPEPAPAPGQTRVRAPEPAPVAERPRRRAPVPPPEPVQAEEPLQLREPMQTREPAPPADPAPAPEPAPEAAQERPQRARAVPAEEPFFQALEKVTGPPRGSKGRDRSPPSGLG